MRALVLSRFMVAYSRVLMRSVEFRRRNAEGLADTVLVAAVYVGQSEGKPMSAHKLAQFCGIPRPTVVRKLRELSAVGLLELHNGAFRLPLDTIESELFAANTLEMERLVHKASRDLSKLDSAAIAQRKKK